MIDWNDKKVLVAGGAGQIGSHLAKELVKRGAFVRIVDSLLTGSEKNLDEIELGYSLWRLDLRNYGNCVRSVKNVDYVFQLAANMGGMGFISKYGVQIMHDNIMINANMLKAAQDANVERFFFSSSACVYPVFLQETTNASSINLKESDAIPADPNEFYGWEKLFMEKLCEAYQQDYEMDIRIARFHNVFGKVYTAFDKERGKAPCQLIAKALKYDGGQFEIWGDGKQTRSFLYVDDCVDGVLKLMDSDYDKPINIGSDRLVTIQELADIIIKISGKKIDSFFYNMEKPQGVRGRNSNNALVRKVLGWEPKYSLEEGLRRTYEWAKERKEELVNI